MKRCPKCKKTKNDSEFHKKSLKGKIRAYCKSCENEINRKRYWNNRSNELIRSKKYREFHRNEARKYSKKYIRQLREEVLTHYGGNPPKCQCKGCNESNILFLTIDHVKNDGAEHRKQIKYSGGWRFYFWLKKNNFPEGYRVLCYNCNCGKQRNDGICPHIKESE
jgi:hypothetical protein